MADKIEPVAFTCPHDPDSSSAFAWPGTARCSTSHTTPLYSQQQLDALVAERNALRRGIVQRDDDLIVPNALWDELDILMTLSRVTGATFARVATLAAQQRLTTLHAHVQASACRKIADTTPGGGDG